MDKVLRQNLESNAARTGVAGCTRCNGLGYLFDPFGGGARDSGYVLCECVKAITICDPKPPFEYYDSEKNAMLPCPSRPARIATDRVNILRRKSGVPKRFQHRFIDSVQMDNRADPGDISLIGAYDEAIHTIQDYGLKKIRGLYYYGDTGCGKTLLACAILNELIRLYRIPVKYAKISRDVLGRLRASFNPNSEFYGEGRKIEEELATIPALVIDEFGVHKETEWVNSVLYDLIDSRYENDLLTIITSNDPLNTWKDVGNGRVYSRLKQMCIEIPIRAPDYRLRESMSHE